jgi:hypothetical protein
MPATYVLLVVLVVMYVLEGGLGGSPGLIRMVYLGAQAS